MSQLELSRIDKLFADRDRVQPNDARKRRADHTVTLALGTDVARSAPLQLAVLTAAALVERCFPGGTRVAADPGVLASPLLIRQATGPTLADAFTETLGRAGWDTLSDAEGSVLIFGDAIEGARTGHIVTFDGWVAVTGPVGLVQRQPERDICRLAPVQASALAVSEIFQRFAHIDVMAGRRVAALSLWRPELDPFDLAALGGEVGCLPGRAWLLGLGHLGNAYAWTLAALPYANPADALFYLLDYDEVEKGNVETGVVFREADITHRKTRVVSAWLEARGFNTRMVERKFVESFRVIDDEPMLAFSGFDNNDARRALPMAGFKRVIDTGLGATSDNFDSIGLRLWPNPRTPEDLWPATTARDLARRAERELDAARNNAAYLSLGGDECGRVMMAGKSVAVPFVGLTAACLGVAEALRLLNDGPKFESMKLRLGRIGEGASAVAGNYGVNDLVGIAYADARRT